MRYMVLGGYGVAARVYKSLLSRCILHKPSLYKQSCKGLFTTASTCNDFSETLTPQGDSKNDTNWMKSGNESFAKRLGYFTKLGKMRLTGLVTMSAAATYLIAPGPVVPFTLAATSLGTFLCSSSANAFNQFVEVPYDCQMARTKDRVLVRGLMRPSTAARFGVISGAVGVAILVLGVNSLTASMGLLNIILYAGIYTPSKRVHIANTWIGAVVGAIPPLMGWAACTGGLDVGALVIAGILYSWQFPHFNSLSWNYRPDYSRAGYRMMSVTDPDLCRRVTLRHGVAQIPLSVSACLLGITNWSFLVMSLPFNIYLALLSWEFYRNSNNNTARKLFRCTLWHLPVIMFFLIICKYRSTPLHETEEES